MVELWKALEQYDQGGYGAAAVANIIKASCGEASMMARCTGKTQLHNLEPEDLRALTLATAEATDILLVGKH
ncbi:MAG: hypothetical protein O7I42_16585 [Alphaproteobacteria bacterium]|nr:hypothetical protein [Alphaproteobacteria bacterium]